MTEQKQWYRDNYLRVLFDITVTDAPPEALSKINPEDLVATIAEAGLQTLVHYVQCPTGWLYYPSRIGQQHPRLQGRDIIGEAIDACRRHGLKFMGYYVPYEMGCETVIHPEWRTEFIGDRVPSSPRLWGNLCWNRPGAWEFFLGIVRESVSRYEMDGVFFDNFWRRHCGCAHCQKRYLDETGRQLPDDFTGPNHQYVLKDPERPEVGAYLHHATGWVNQWAMDLRRTVLEARPGCAITFQYVGANQGGNLCYDVGMAQAADFTGQDIAFLSDQYKHSYNLKCVRGFTRNLPFDCHMSIAEHHSDEVSPKQEGLLKQQFAYVLSLGSSITYIDDMLWDGTISKKKYVRMKKVNEWASRRFPYLGGQLLADVGLYFSHESQLYHPRHTHWRWNPVRGDAERGSMHNAGNAGFVQAMLRENIPFDIFHRHTPGDLDRYKVIYMNSVEVLSEPEAEALRRYVNGGGGLVVTHRTGLRDEQYRLRENFLLSDILGADYLETPDLATSFIHIRPDDRVEGFFENVHAETPFFEVHCSQCHVRPREAALGLGRIARPRRPVNEDFWPVPGNAPVRQLVDPAEVRQSSVSAIYAPEIVTERPAIVLNRHGRGRVAYLAAFPCYDYVDDIHELIMSLVHWAAGGRLDPTVQTNAPGPVEIIAMEQPQQHRTILHAVNWQPSWPAVVAHGVEVAIRNSGRSARRAYAVEAQRDVPLLARDGRTHVTFPPVEAWETVVIEWQ